ncbi:MAG TPA: circularly permuted type 2 ATP-grasp protein, partial [Alphaproteobacteria bacterium]|nr:circularly permuted type 2 ATP-grasp protein [Alphaproteobacteria bacterium]
MDLSSAAMSQAPFSSMRQVSAEYRPNPDAFDEMMTPQGDIRPHWQPFISWLQNLPADELERRWSRVERILFENGLAFSATVEPQSTARNWSLDAIPLILPQQEWRQLEAGLVQRARLLNALLADLYGPQRLLLDGTLPAALVYGNPQFLRPCHNIEARDGIFLNYYAADLGRSPDGKWWVLNDRCQAPEGGGFALENRIAMSHGFQEQFRDNNVQRLAAFFLAMRDGHMSLVGHDNPRVVV